jgi:hypothetical protein
MQSRACSGFAEPQPTLAIVISITVAKLQKIPETAKHFRKYFQRKSAQKEIFFCMAASSDPS